MKITHLSFIIVLIFYFASSIFYILYSLLRREKLTFLGGIFCKIGFILHIVALIAHLSNPDNLSRFGLRESLSIVSWAMILAFLIFEMRFKLKLLGAFLLPFAFMALVYSSVIADEIKPINIEFRSGLLGFHIIITLCGIVCFTISFCTSLLFIFQEKKLKSKRPGLLSAHLPSLEFLDQISFQTLKIGFPLLTLGILSGSLIWFQSSLKPGWSFGIHSKELWALVAWFIYAGLLETRRMLGWRGKKGALLGIAGFCAILLTLLWTIHAFRIAG